MSIKDTRHVSDGDCSAAGVSSYYALQVYICTKLTFLFPRVVSEPGEVDIVVYIL